MSFFSRIKAFFSTAFEFFRPAINTFASRAGQILAKSALEAVKVVGQNAIDGDDKKRDKAFKKIVEDLKSNGIQVGVDVGTSMVNLAIETALQKIKAEGGD